MVKYFMILTFLVKVIICRDFYIGMFKKNDLLVAQDVLYKERVAFRSVYAKYGRIFKCQITYLHVVDRLGIGRGPRVELIRGGLQHKYVVLRLTSPYNYPVSVNIYVGCENKLVTKSFTRKIVATKTTTNGTTTTTTTTTNKSKSSPSSSPNTTKGGESASTIQSAGTGTKAGKDGINSTTGIAGTGTTTT